MVMANALPIILREVHNFFGLFRFGSASVDSPSVLRTRPRVTLALAETVVWMVTLLELGSYHVAFVRRTFRLMSNGM